jgi:hypothetical protein
MKFARASADKLIYARDGCGNRNFRPDARRCLPGRATIARTGGLVCNAARWLKRPYFFEPDYFDSYANLVQRRVVMRKLSSTPRKLVELQYVILSNSAVSGFRSTPKTFTT